MSTLTKDDSYGVLFHNTNIVSIGIDYLTVTSATQAGKKALILLWAKYRAIEERLGNNVKKQGFQGYQGESCGPLMFGRREDTFLLKRSSSGAYDLFKEIPWAECHCSRIDLEFTVQLPAYNENIAKALSERRKAHFARLGRKIEPIQEMPDRAGRGDELKIGSRESPRYGRVYDKQREQKDEGWTNCWRWEVEYKGVVAPRIVKFLLQEPDLNDAIVATLLGQFKDWNIETPITGREVLVAGSVGRRAFDSDRAIKWLQTQVAPTCEKLLATVSRDEVLKALGLQELATTQLAPITSDWLRATGQNGLKSRR